MARTIAWIEDDIDIIEPVVEMLKRDGFQIERFRSVGEALDKIDALRGSDLILLDILLSQGEAQGDYGRYSGITLLKELQERHGLQTPVVVLSVITNRDARRQLQALGVEDIITKPVLPSELRDRVRKALADIETWRLTAEGGLQRPIQTEGC